MSAIEEVLAATIVEWLISRNGGQLRKKLDSQKVSDRKLMLEELALILRAGGIPSNWVDK